MSTTVFCIDFDETLSNTDRLRADLVAAITRLGGEALASAYQEAYEAVRLEYGVPRMPLILRAIATHAAVDTDVHHQLTQLLHDFAYQDYLYPGVEQLVRHLKKIGDVLIFSDGDAFFQSHKIYATSLATLVTGVVVLPRKVDYFDELCGFWPADRYVFIDDKQKVLASAKEYFGDQATTIYVQQGRYAGGTLLETTDTSVPVISDVSLLFPV